MTDWGETHRADVVILTAIRLEFEAVLKVDAGAVPGSKWEIVDGPSGLPVGFRSFVVESGRPLRVAVALSPDMGATAATNTLLPLVEALKPQCIAMCGVCAGKRGKTQLGDVVAAERLFYYDTGKRLPDAVQQDLTTYKLRDDWKIALERMDGVVRSRFGDEEWFTARPISTEWREHRALVALRDGLSEPGEWADRTLDAHSWKQIVTTLRERKLLAETGRELTEAAVRSVNDLLFEHMGALPDLSPAGTFQPFRLHVAPLGAGTQVVEDEAIWGFVSLAMRKTLGLEMEGAALGELAHRQRRYGLDAVVMKGVMDFADHGRDDHFKEFAARGSAECLLWFLRERIPTELAAGIDDLLAPGTVPPPRGAPSPSFLLNARHAIVPWHDAGRSELLADLDAWADDPSREVAVRLLHAEGGVGKTRLAIEWVKRRSGRHDVAGFLVPKPDNRWLERLCGRGSPIVVVIDYAESRADTADLLERVAAFAAGPGPRRRIRLLLLARGDGDWWAELARRSTAVGSLLSDVAALKLTPLAVTTTEREAVFAEAALAFASKRNRPAVLRPPISLEDPRFERVLYLHMAALAAVEGVEFDAGSLMDVVLDHEERFWMRESQTLTVDVALARELVAAATLRGGLATKAAAREMCGRLAERAVTREDDELIALLHRVYERVREPDYLPALEPDLLGEGMILRVATPPRGNGSAVGDSWIERVFVPGEQGRALMVGFTVLGRASAVHADAVRAWIAVLLRTDLAARALVAIQVAKIVGQRTALSRLGDLVADALEERGSASIASELAAIEIPHPTVSLPRVAEWRSRKLAEGLSEDDDETATAARASSQRQRSIDLDGAGQREAALATARESADLYRALAIRNRDAFQPNLASALNDLGIRLSSLGQRTAALDVTREAEGLFRALAEAHPDVFQADHANSLNNLGSMLNALGQREDALAATFTSVGIFRNLAWSNPDGAFLPQLATGLTNLGEMLSAMGWLDKALTTARTAADLYRALASAYPDAFQPAFATSLSNLGARLSALGQREAALAATREAVDVTRALAARHPARYEPSLAKSINNLAVTLSDLGYHDLALATIREAVVLRRALASRNPDAFQPDLAEGLLNLGSILNALRHSEEALATTQEAADLYSALAARTPDVFQPFLGKSLNSLCTTLSVLGRRDDSLVAARACVGTFRQLATRNPDAFYPDLAMALGTLGNALRCMLQLEEAVVAMRESVALRRALAACNADAFQPDLAKSLNNLGLALADLNAMEEGLAITREAVELRRALAARNAQAFEPDLASSLINLGNMLASAGEREAALAATREAVDLYRALATRTPEAFQADLAGSLSNLGVRLSEIGQRSAALETSVEALDLIWPVFLRSPRAYARETGIVMQTVHASHERLDIELSDELKERADIFSRLTRNVG